MFCGSATWSPLPSAPQRCQVPGRNCIGPTARSNFGSPSSTPWSVSRTAFVPCAPSSGIPTIGVGMEPSGRAKPPGEWPWRLSLNPMPARPHHCSPQVGLETAIACAARQYASSATRLMFVPPTVDADRAEPAVSPAAFARNPALLAAATSCGRCATRSPRWRRFSECARASAATWRSAASTRRSSSASRRLDMSIAPVASVVVNRSASIASAFAPVARSSSREWSVV